MKRLWRYEFRIVLLFLVLLAVYLTIAWTFHDSRGYYGTTDAPRFADPWIARTETIVSGGLLYRDVFTTTPPLTNYLLVPPSLLAKLAGLVNPWATLSFMVYFSFFNLLAAFALFFMANSRQEGWIVAAAYLLNPLTFGNTVLRRQDESILAFFFGLGLLLLIKRQHIRASIAIGLTILIKLTGAVLVPLAFLHTRNWRYLVIPLVVFVLVVSPFLVLAGRDAVFWDFTKKETEHPFQFGGVSPYTLWNRAHDAASQIPVEIPSIVMVVCVAATALLVTWQRYGPLRDLTILLSAVFVLSPKLHAGYFSLLVLTITPLLRSLRHWVLCCLFGVVVLVADFLKWPVEDFDGAFWLMIVAVGIWIILVVQTCFKKDQPALLAD